MDEISKKDIGFWKQILYTCIVYMAFCLIGMTRGYSTFLLQQLKSSDSDIPITLEQASWIASLNIFPNPIGSILVGVLMDKLGRRISMKISIGFFIIGWTIIAFCSNICQLYLGDIIIGIAIGMALCSTVYVAEISQLQYRCMLLSLFIIFFSLGILISYVLTCYLTWRIAALIFSTFSFITLILLHFIPESPYWYIKTGQHECALNALKKLRGDITEAKHESECQEIMYNLSTEKKSSFSLQTVFQNWKPFSIFVMFQICLQGSGYSILVTYLSSFLEKFQFPLDKVNKIAIGYSFLTFTSSFLSPFTVNMLNRKNIMKISASGMTISMLIIVIYQIIDSSQKTIELSRWLVPIGLYMYVFMSTVGAVTVSESMPSELYATEVRGMMCGLTEAFATILTGLCVKIYPALQSIVHVTYIVAGFTLFSFLMLLFGIFILPETHGKTLSEIQDLHFKKNQKSQSNEKV